MRSTGQPGAAVPTCLLAGERHTLAQVVRGGEHS